MKTYVNTHVPMDRRIWKDKQYKVPDFKKFVCDR